MKNKQNRIARLTNTGLIVTLAASTFLPFIGQAWAAQGADTAGSAATLARIEIEYKMDPRVSRGLYMGERWITPPTYITTLDNVEIRARGVDAKGATVAIRPQWIPSDPEMVMVTPSEGSQAKITVKRAGESRLEVKAGGVSKELAFKAAYKDDALQRVEIAPLATEAPALITSTPQAPALESPYKSPKEKLSYALGMSLVSQLRAQGIELDADLYVQGFRDAHSGSGTGLTETEARAALNDLQNEMKRKQMGSKVEKMKELAEKNQRSGEAFLAANKTREGVVSLESGLQYKILKAGDGQKPTADDTVVCHYRGTLIDGTEFDSSHKRNQPATFQLKRVIKGWTETLQLMPVGSKWQLFIPASFAYGERGGPGGRIGPNATLIFEVELLSISEKQQVANGGGPAAALHQDGISKK